MEESMLKALLEEGITAAKAGQKERARQCLMQVVETDESNEQAWLWLSGVVESLEDKQVCLENVLALNPDSSPAKKGLAWMAQQRAERGLSPAPSPAVPTPVTSTPPEPEPLPDFPPAPAPPTSAIPSTEGPPDQVIAPPAQPPPAPTPAAAPTSAVRYERRRKRESRSAVLKLLSVGWGLYGLLSIVFGGLVLFASSLVPRMLENPELWAELGAGQYANLTAAAEMGPPWGIGFIAFGGFCIALAVGLLTRLKAAFFASFVMAVLTFGVFFYFAVASEGGCCCWGLPMAPIVFFGLTFFARDDFAMEEVAIEEERAEHAPGSPLDHYNRAAAYARQKKLALAIQEWERAVELAPDNIRFRNALALAYAGQGQKEKAIALLEETLALAPDDAETRRNLKAVQEG